MQKLRLLIYSIAFIFIFYSCCLNNEDSPVDNTLLIEIFNLDKSDDLLDFEGPIVFDTVKLLYADNREEILSLADNTSRELGFWLSPRTERSESSDFILELDSLSFSLSIAYTGEELTCGGTEFSMSSYTFEGEDYEADQGLGRNRLELLLDL